MKLAGKVLVVTGAGSGIGRAVALEALRRRAKVAAVDLNRTTLEETASLAAADGDLSTHPLDITDRAAVEALPEQVTGRFGAVDGIVHCAGIIQPFVTLRDLDYAAIERVFAVNWSGTLYLTKTFLPPLLARPEGHIVNVASMGGFLPVPGQTIYGASKAAVKLLTEGLHSECAGTNVHVTAVFPGGVATNITTNSGVAIPVGDPEAAAQAHKITTPDRAARDILDGVEKNAYRVLIGRDAKLMDLLYRVNPRRSAGLIADKMKDLLRG
ncbi:SDR family NAD(P)-dependent oxidoreductase [Planosporangium mesophilum]|uniref:Short-chain dehydrogenase n=1 Tax=Planosporangium mesophilum TaxID=689768 RepID=A0A8J3X298_9ACTN|nr:SDR family oxidoreductase [Planosporangium mesophilum]NJC82904.1 SDR family oxidoreductase [Planosporangium mesophilum]GII24681.1 short-chain dehydrogenase [Planosporangium mesophilum]